MAGTRQRSLSAFYAGAGRPSGDEAEGSGPRRTRGRRRARRPPTHTPTPTPDEVPVDERPVEDRDNDDDQELAPRTPTEEQGGSGSTSTAARQPYLRGHSTLPPIPAAPGLRPVISPAVDLSGTWDLVSPGDSRNVNGVLGALVRQQFPGVVEYHGRNEPAYTFGHYAEAEDDEYGNKAERVKAEFWRYFQPMEGTEAACAENLVQACRKRVTDMHYDVKARQAIAYFASVKSEKLDPAVAKRTTLSYEQYMQVVPSWCLGREDAWQMMVEKWLSADYQKSHDEASARRLMMDGPAHHQGSSNLNKYKQRWLAANPGRTCTDYSAYCLAHKGKATSGVTFSADDGPEAYSNPTIGARICEYTSAARESSGEDFDPSTHEFDGTLVMRLGHGKRHGRLSIGNNCIDATDLSLASIRARSTSSDPPIRQRMTPASRQIEQLQAQVNEANERAARAEQAIAATQEGCSQRLDQLTAFLAASGFTVPPSLFGPLVPTGPPPSEQHCYTPPPSAGSNNPPQAAPGEQAFPSPGVQHPFL